MKKSIYLLAAGALALTACTSEEVLTEGMQSNAIGFENVVGKQSRLGATDITNSGDNALKTFNVFGYYTIPNTANTAVLVFNNEKVTKQEGQEGEISWDYSNTRYWVPGASYWFYAYNCGNVEKLGTQYGHFAMDVKKSTAEDRVLKVIEYVCDETHQHDLVYASKHVAPTQVTEGENTTYTYPESVAFKFDHILAKIDAKFKSSLASDYTVEINNVKVEGINNKGNFTPKVGDTDAAWTDFLKAKMTYTDKETGETETTDNPFVLLYKKTGEPLLARKAGTINIPVYDEIKQEEIEEVVSTTEHAFVIPCEYEDATVAISFDIVVKKGNDTVLSRHMTGSFAPDWKIGYYYTYTIDITGDAANLNAIVFTTEKDPVSGWKEESTEDTDFTFSAN